MKSSNPSLSPLRRALVAATVVMATGNLALLAQTANSTPGSPSATSSSTSTDYNNNSTSSTSSMGSNPSDTSGSQMANNTDTSSSSSSAESSSGKKLSWSDRHFVTKAADDGQQEVAIAQLAAQKATNPDVRNFAQQMADQHTQVNSQLLSLAESKNVKIDKDESKGRFYKRLAKASGNDFDREFIEHIVDEHEKDIKMYEKAASNAKDPDVKQFASTTLDHLKQHLTQAQQLQQSIVPTGRTDANSWKGASSGSSSSTSSSAGTGLSGSGSSPDTTGAATSSSSTTGGTSTATTSVR